MNEALTSAVDFNEKPFLAIREVTQACVHCRAFAQPDRHPMELTTEEGKVLIDRIAAGQVPECHRLLIPAAAISAIS